MCTILVLSSHGEREDGCNTVTRSSTRPAQAAEVLLLIVVQQKGGPLTAAPGIHLKALVLQGSGDYFTHFGPNPAGLFGGERVLSNDFT